MLRLREANQPVPQARLFPASGKSHGNSGQGISGQNRSGEGIVGGSNRSTPTAMLTAGALCRDQVKRVVETAASQRLVVTAIPDKPKAMASSISRKDTEMKAAKSIVLWGAREQLFCLALAAISLFGVESAIAFAKDRPAYFLPEERRIIENYYRSGRPFERVAAGFSKAGRKASSRSSEASR